MRSLSISLRLAAWYTAISLVGFAIFGAAMWWVLASSMISWKDRTLQMRALRVEAVLEASRGESPAQIRARLDEIVGILPEGELIQIVRGNGQALFPIDRKLAAPELPQGRMQRALCPRSPVWQGELSPALPAGFVSWRAGICGRAQLADGRSYPAA